MTPDVVLEYSTEGGVHLLADLEAAALWRGLADDGSGVMVDYMGAAVVKLPDRFLKVRKPGRHSKKFATLAEAETFARDLVSAFEEAVPEAKRLSDDSPIYSIGSDRAFSVEVSFHTALNGVQERMKGPLFVTAIDRKAKTSKKAQGIFFEVEDGGRGVVVADTNAGIIVIAKFHYAGDHDQVAMAKALAALQAPKGKASVKLGGRVLFFPATVSAADLSRRNWQGDSLLEHAVSVFERTAGGGALAVPDQAVGGGAYIRVPAGDYAVSYKSDVTVGDVGANVLWCVRT